MKLIGVGTVRQIPPCFVDHYVLLLALFSSCQSVLQYEFLKLIYRLLWSRLLFFSLVPIQIIRYQLATDWYLDLTLDIFDARPPRLKFACLWILVIINANFRSDMCRLYQYCLVIPWRKDRCSHGGGVLGSCCLPEGTGERPLCRFVCSLREKQLSAIDRYYDASFKRRVGASDQETVKKSELRGASRETIVPVIRRLRMRR